MADEHQLLATKVLTTEELYNEKNAFFEKQKEEHYRYFMYTCIYVHLYVCVHIFPCIYINE
jgi:hypothetical protein